MVGRIETSCAACGGRDILFLFKARDEIVRNPGVFTLVRCRGCGLAWVDPLPTTEELARYYPYWKEPEESPEYRSTAVVRGMQAEKISKIGGIARVPGRVLDVGCGAGEFLVEMKAGGWEAHGVEYSPVTSGFARQRFGLDVKTGDLMEARYPDGYFDCVTFWSVLEHLHAPGTILEEVRRILKPEGWLIIQLPNRASIQARVFRQAWFHLNIPRHLYHFTPRALGTLLGREGLMVRRWDFFSGTQGHIAYGFGLKRWMGFGGGASSEVSVAPVTAATESSRGSWKQGVNRLMDAAFKPLAFVESCARLGGVVTVYARPGSSSPAG